MGDVFEATEKSIRMAGHLTDADAGAVETLRALARTIDDTDERWDLAMAYYLEHKTPGMKPPGVDNVSIPTYLKFCESLGLTPAGRVRLTPTKGAQPSGRLADLRAIRGGRSAATG